MAKNQSEFDTELTSLETTQAAVIQAQATLITDQATLITETTNAFNRFLAKIAAGANFQPEFDRVSTLVTNLGAASTALQNADTAVQSAIAQAQSEGN